MSHLHTQNIANNMQGAGRSWRGAKTFSKRLKNFIFAAASAAVGCWRSDGCWMNRKSQKSTKLRFNAINGLNYNTITAAATTSITTLTTFHTSRALYRQGPRERISSQFLRPVYPEGWTEWARDKVNSVEPKCMQCIFAFSSSHSSHKGTEILLIERHPTQASFPDLILYPSSKLAKIE